MSNTMILVVMTTAVLLQTCQAVENRQIFRGDVEKFKSRPQKVPQVEYDPYQSDYQSEYQPDDHYDYQTNDYQSNRPSYEPTYHDEYQPHSNQQDDYQPDYQKPSSYNQYHSNEHSEGHNDGYNSEYYSDDYEPVQVYQKKPRPTYPKEVVLLQPGPAVKAVNPYVHKPDGYHSGAVPGTAGKDYPNYSSVPDTSFQCPKSAKTSETYYDQMYSDPEAGCQVFHSCHADGRTDSFLCPLGTIFDSHLQTCDWWFNTSCV